MVWPIEKCNALSVRISPPWIRIVAVSSLTKENKNRIQKTKLGLAYMPSIRLNSRKNHRRSNLPHVHLTMATYVRLWGSKISTYMVLCFSSWFTNELLPIFLIWNTPTYMQGYTNVLKHSRIKYGSRRHTFEDVTKGCSFILEVIRGMEEIGPFILLLF